MKQILIVRSNPEEVAESASEWLVEKLKSAIAERDRCVIAVSGGSTPKRLYQILAELPEGRIPWSKVHMIWGDERNVPLDHPDSNFGMVRHALLTPLGKAGPNVYPVPIDEKQPQKTADYYEATLRSLFGIQDHRFPSIDIALLGLGDDAHTASLFPFTPALSEMTRWVASNWVEKLSSHRVTLTAPVFNAASHVAFLVCGAGKRQALQSIWHGERDPKTYPAQLIQPKSGELVWILDQAAVESVDPPK